MIGTIVSDKISKAQRMLGLTYCCINMYRYFCSLSPNINEPIRTMVLPSSMAMG